MIDRGRSHAKWWYTFSSFSSVSGCTENELQVQDGASIAITRVVFDAAGERHVLQQMKRHGEHNGKEEFHVPMGDDECQHANPTVPIHFHGLLTDRAPTSPQPTALG